MTVTAAMVKRLRAATAAGILDCSKALQEHGGDFDFSIGGVGFLKRGGLEGGIVFR